MLDRMSRYSEVKIARPAHSIDPGTESVVSKNHIHSLCVFHTQVCQIPATAQVDSLQVTAAEARAVARWGASEQVAYRERGVYAAGVATEVMKVAVCSRHSCGDVL